MVCGGGGVQDVGSRTLMQVVSGRGLLGHRLGAGVAFDT